MTIDFRSLANDGVRNLTPYQPGKPIEELERELGITSSIKLASNENPLGASPNAILAAQNELLNAHIYPDGSCYQLKLDLAAFLAVNPNQITVGNGSENILEIIIKSYLHTDDTVVISKYAFIAIPLLIKGHGAIAKVVESKNWGHDIPAMIRAIDAKTRVLFLVNPNNPTGTYITENDFRMLMESVPPQVIVVVDEAYSEYITASDYPKTIQYLNQYPNLIISRTFSKAYGLAGLRVGFAISSPEIADILNRARMAFNVNSIALSAASAALKDQDHVKKSVTLNTNGMRQLEIGLKKLNLSFIPSIGNFITIDVGDGSAIYQKLLYEGVIVRPLNVYDMPNHIRVTIGTMAQNERFLAAIQKVMSP